MRGRADILLLLSPHISARSQQSKFANYRSPPIHPYILTRHRSTAELPVVGIETSRTESLTEEPSHESHDLAMSRLRTRETIIRPGVGLALHSTCVRVLEIKATDVLLLYTAVLL